MSPAVSHITTRRRFFRFLGDDEDRSRLEELTEREREEELFKVRLG